MNDFLTKLEPLSRNAMRIIAAFLWWSHGAQKIMGWFGGFGQDGGTADLFTRFGAAGMIEFFLGLAIILGLFTRPAAFIASGEMAVTFFWMHVPRGSFWPWENRGEVVALYAFVFLFIAASGGGDFSLDGWWRRRKAAAAG
jgi:putative oxidoreductase